MAWQWTSVDDAVVAANPTARPGAYQDTPLMADGVLYTVTSLGQIAALDPGTGVARWVFDPGSWKTGRPGNLGFVHRGLAYWTDGAKARLLLGTGDAYLIAVDARTGTLDPSFGTAGRVDLDGRRGAGNPRNDILQLVGANRLPGRRDRRGQRARRADDEGMAARATSPGSTCAPAGGCGRFRSIPEKGTFGHDTWSGDAAEYTGSTNVWTTMSADEALGLVYLPFGTPTNDFYGGHRPGANLFAESMVALDVTTGARRWHFQAVHHGVWDYDLPAAPTLVDITVDGRRIQAVAQVSKQGFTYVLDRRSGTPVWPIEERPVPQSAAPGERSSPTQPVPSKPPPFERQGLTDDDLIDFTPELRQRAIAALTPFDRGPLFTPPSERGTVQLPGWVGGANWGGAAFDPETGRLFVPSLTSPTMVQLVKPDPEKSNFQLRRGGLMITPSIDGLPVVKPPYGRVTALDLHHGTIAWMTPIGDGPRHHPHIAHLNLPPLGMETRGNPLVTQTLLFVAQGGPNLAPAPPASGSSVKLPLPETRKLYALDKASGTGAVGRGAADCRTDGLADDLPAPRASIRGRGDRCGALDRLGGLRAAALSAATVGRDGRDRQCWWWAIAGAPALPR